MPRSPRATMTPSATATMSSTASTASGISILATSMGPPEEGSATRARSTSSAERTNDSATASTSASTRAASSRRSSSVGEERARRPLGMLTPGRPWTQPPVMTSTVARSPWSCTTRSSMAPSPSTTRSPSWSESPTSGWSTAMRATVLVSSGPAGTRSMRVPSSRWTPPSGNSAARILGPGRSARMPTVRPASAATVRMRAMRSSDSSSGPCARERRAMSMPSSMRARRVDGDSEAGPMVATIFVRRDMQRRLRHGATTPAAPQPANVLWEAPENGYFWGSLRGICGGRFEGSGRAARRADLPCAACPTPRPARPPSRCRSCSGRVARPTGPPASSRSRADRR